MPPPSFTVRLTRTRMLSPSVRELVWTREDGTPFEFAAGQWISFVLPLEEGEARRAYSIASAPDGTPTFDVAITRVEGGQGSAFLHAIEEGHVLRAIGPQGFFTRALAQPTLFIGTGTGATPLRSMVKDALAKGDSAPMVLLLGMRREEDRIYHDELEQLAAKHPQLRVEYTLSRGSDDWSGLRGYVQTHVERIWGELTPAGAPHAYVCGLEKMVSAVRDVLRKQMNVERKQVHSERYD